MNTSQLQRAIATLAGNLLCLLLLLGSPLAQAADLKVYYLHTDHLDTPRLMTDEQNRVVWKNGPLAEPFGLELPNEDPDGDGVRLTLNLRFPGQYFDKESGLHYNYYRDYDPLTGRYMQSDPIGLAGGINTYAYVEGNPLGLVDLLGLSDQDVEKIRERYREIVDQMTRNELRLPNKWRNNLCRMYPWSPGCKNPNNYKDCGEQTEIVNEELAKGHYNDRWYFLMDAGFGHAWGLATSSNPKDPIVYYDPRADEISVGNPCQNCKGWFGDSNYGPNDPPIHPR